MVTYHLVNLLTCEFARPKLIDSKLSLEEASEMWDKFKDIRSMAGGDGFCLCRISSHSLNDLAELTAFGYERKIYSFRGEFGETEQDLSGLKGHVIFCPSCAEEFGPYFDDFSLEARSDYESWRNKINEI